MTKIITDELIKQKLSGKYGNLYPVFTKLIRLLDKIPGEINVILKTIYIIVEFENGAFGVIFWSDDALDFLLPITISHPRLESAKKYKYGGLSKKIALKSEEDVDEFLEDLLFRISTRQ